MFFFHPLPFYALLKNISGSQVVKLLTTLGADVVCPDEAEATAYDWAMQGMEGWLVLWLCQHMLENDVYLLVKSHRDLTRPGPLNGGLVREIPLFQGNLGW